MSPEEGIALLPTLMNPKTLSTVLLAAAISAGPAALQAQFNQFTIDGHAVQVHGFASQGFTLSGDNNYLTMNSSKGSFAFTDGGLSLSTNITDKFRVGAQAYVRDIGTLGKGHVTLDWAFGDYKFKDWFGVRAGKIKTVLGLFNDTQDAESLHTWAILPQSLYPLDLRAANISHKGGDIYGDISLHKAGSLSYTAYAGTRSNDTRGGTYYAAADAGTPTKTYTGSFLGEDVRWNTPVSGLMIGTSFLDTKADVTGTISAYGGAPFAVSFAPLHTIAAYADYTRGKLRLNGEFRSNQETINARILGNTTFSDQSDKGWFASAAYHVTSKLELGTYHSRFYVNSPKVPSNKASDHIFDQTITARYDIAKWWDFKVEEHFIDGYGDVYSAHGFYSRSNPQGLKPKTNLFVVRTGFYF